MLEPVLQRTGTLRALLKIKLGLQPAAIHSDLTLHIIVTDLQSAFTPFIREKMNPNMTGPSVQLQLRSLRQFAGTKLVRSEFHLLFS